MKTHDNLPSTRVEKRDLVAPFGLLQNRIDRVFHDFSRNFGVPDAFWDESPAMAELWARNGDMMPSVDVHEANGKMMITADLPGVDENDLDISVRGDILTISGEKKAE